MEEESELFKKLQRYNVKKSTLNDKYRRFNVVTFLTL